MPQMEKFGKASATTTDTSARGFSSRARSAALIPASLPPIMTRCMASSRGVGWLVGLAGARCLADGRVGAIAGGGRGANLVGDDDLRRLRWGEVGIQGSDHHHGQRAADDLGGDERRDRR